MGKFRWETIEIQCLPCVRSHHLWLQANHQQIQSDDDFWQSHSQSPILLSTGLPNIWHPSSPAKQDGRCKDESAEWCMMLGCLINKMTSSLPWAVFIKFLAPFRYERNILRNVELGFVEFQSCQLCWNPWLQSLCFLGNVCELLFKSVFVIHVQLVVRSIKLQVTLHPSGLVWHTPTPPKITLWYMVTVAQDILMTCHMSNFVGQKFEWNGSWQARLLLPLVQGGVEQSNSCDITGGDSVEQHAVRFRVTMFIHEPQSAVYGSYHEQVYQWLLTANKFHDA